jgi:hypothetical protein
MVKKVKALTNEESQALFEKRLLEIISNRKLSNKKQRIEECIRTNKGLFVSKQIQSLIDKVK